MQLFGAAFACAPINPLAVMPCGTRELSNICNKLQSYLQKTTPLLHFFLSSADISFLIAFCYQNYCCYHKLVTVRLKHQLLKPKQTYPTGHREGVRRNSVDPGVAKAFYTVPKPSLPSDCVNVGDSKLSQLCGSHHPFLHCLWKDTPCQDSASMRMQARYAKLLINWGGIVLKIDDQRDVKDVSLVSTDFVLWMQQSTWVQILPFKTNILALGPSPKWGSLLLCGIFAVWRRCVSPSSYIRVVKTLIQHRP